MAFPLALRIPQWAGEAVVTVNGKRAAGVRPAVFYVADRIWRAGDIVELKFHMKLRVSRWYRDSAAVEHFLC